MCMMIFIVRAWLLYWLDCASIPIRVRAESARSLSDRMSPSTVPSSRASRARAMHCHCVCLCVRWNDTSTFRAKRFSKDPSPQLAHLRNQDDELVINYNPLSVELLLSHNIDCFYCYNRFISYSVPQVLMLPRRLNAIN